MRYVITIVGLVILVSIAAFWAKDTFDRTKLVTTVEATERPVTISPYEIMVTHGKDLPVEKHTADPF